MVCLFVCGLVFLLVFFVAFILSRKIFYLFIYLFFLVGLFVLRKMMILIQCFLFLLKINQMMMQKLREMSELFLLNQYIFIFLFIQSTHQKFQNQKESEDYLIYFIIDQFYMILKITFVCSFIYWITYESGLISEDSHLGFQKLLITIQALFQKLLRNQKLRAFFSFKRMLNQVYVIWLIYSRDVHNLLKIHSCSYEELYLQEDSMLTFCLEHQSLSKTLETYLSQVVNRVDRLLRQIFSQRNNSNSHPKQSHSRTQQFSQMVLSDEFLFEVNFL
ncbi:hypothetical protein ABPG72_012665 [Tetrahymena utriculariae]